MARLIVEENGTQRAFRLGNGVVTIGSGAGARLVLRAPGVADVHAELELSGAAIRLRARPGVAPPSLGGAPVTGESAVMFGQTIQIGGALLRVERDEAALVEEGAAAPAAARSAPPAEAPRPGRSGSAAAARRHHPAGKPKTLQKRESVVDLPGKQREKGLPTWFVVSGFLTVLAVVGLILWKGFQGGMDTELDPTVQLDLAERALVNGDFALFEVHLGRVSSTADLSPADRQRCDQLRERSQEMVLHNENRKRWRQGTEFKQEYLDPYEQKHLQGTVDEAKIPLFLKRCRIFRERWPDHPELDWVERQETRWSAVVSLSDPPTWDAVWWEAYNLTARSSTHDFRTALKGIDEYEPRASPEEREDLVEKRARLVKEREEFFWDEMQLAKHSFDKGEVPTCVQKLVGLVQKIGDEAMEELAAKELVLVLRGAEGMLAAYKEQSPWSYELLVRNATLKAYARELGLE